jgi:hypothetical protein
MILKSSDFKNTIFKNVIFKILLIEITLLNETPSNLLIKITYIIFSILN